MAVEHLQTYWLVVLVTYEIFAKRAEIWTQSFESQIDPD